MPALEDLEAEHVLPGPVGLGPQRLSSPGAETDRREVVASRGLGHLHHLPVGRRQDRDDRDAVLLDLLEHALGREPGKERRARPEAERDDGLRRVPRGQGQRRRTADHVTGLDADAVGAQALAAGVALRLLIPEREGLESVFLELVGEGGIR